MPAGFLSPALKLQSPKEARGSTPEPGDERVTEPEYERPKGRMLLCWGWAEQFAGQPRVVDFATASAADMGKFFQSRHATQRGTHSAVGRPVWPSAADARMLPAGASLVGEHGFTGSGVPEGFRFQIAAAQDLMPPIAIKQKDVARRHGARVAGCPGMPRAYSIAAMGARDNQDMVIWTSSEQPDIGFGLLDYQTNPAVDRWLKEKVLLAPQTTHCAVPKGVFTGQGAMLRMIAYGNELNLAHPPRPNDPRVPWEPVWAVKLRVKSVSMAMLGMDPTEAEAPAAEAPAAEPAKDDKMPGVKDLLKGIFGR
ncbi:MAG: hypothetical protein IPN37_10355 [Betaproteobacteria bacterium]|nr:hypothetical protein [Betaproteobacteria bacterium]